MQMPSIPVGPNAHFGLNGMNLIDWTILLVVSISVVFGMMKGLLRSVLSLVGIIAGILLAGWYCGPLAVRLAPWVHPPALAQVLAFAAILIGVLILAALLGHTLRKFAAASGLGFLDRLGGGLFGFARAVLLLAALLLPMAPLFNNLEVARTSTLLPYLRTAAVGVSSVLPRRFGAYLSSGFGLQPQFGATGRSRPFRRASGTR